ncbi:MAG: hypothetical protein Q9191_001299 [Dirinaria sp. TL-2023a]
MAESDHNLESLGAFLYCSDFPELPADAPVGHPHILDLKCLLALRGQKGPTIPDLVVTVLFKYKPEALKAFLDLGRSEVHFLRRNPPERDFCISRKGKLVKIGYLNESDVRGWHWLYQFHIDDSATGNWSPDLRIKNENTPQEILTLTTNTEEIQQGASMFSFSVAWKEPWVEERDVEIEWVCGLWQGIKEL